MLTLAVYMCCTFREAQWGLCLHIFLLRLLIHTNKLGFDYFDKKVIIYIT